MNTSLHTPTELCALTDSLASTIRWRMRDYETILRAELEILVEPDRAGRPRQVRFAGRSTFDAADVMERLSR